MAKKKSMITTKSNKINNGKGYWKYLAIIPVLIIGIIFTWLYQTKDIVWSIGSETITQDEVKLEIERLKPSDYEQKMKSITDAQEKLDAENAIQAKAMENLLKLKCVYLYAKEKGIKATKADVQSVIDSFQKSLNSNAEEPVNLKEALAEYRISYKSFLRDMKTQAIYNKVLEPVRKEVTVTDEELKKEYEKDTTIYDVKETAHLMLISVTTEAEATEIVKQLDAGKDFKQIAREKSLASDAATNGGDLGWITRDSLLQEIGDNVFHKDLQLNIPFPMQARDGWYVFIVKDRKPAEKKTFEQVKEQVKSTVLYFKQNQAVDAFMVRLTEKYESIVKIGNSWENLLKWWDKLRGKIK